MVELKLLTKTLNKEPVPLKEISEEKKNASVDVQPKASGQDNTTDLSFLERAAITDQPKSRRGEAETFAPVSPKTAAGRSIRTVPHFQQAL